MRRSQSVGGVVGEVGAGTASLEWRFRCVGEHGGGIRTVLPMVRVGP